MTPDLSTAADSLTIAMLVMIAVIAVSLAMVASLFLFIRKSPSRRDRQVDQLLEEVAREEEQRKFPAPPKPPQPEPWEKDVDWWKR